MKKKNEIEIEVLSTGEIRFRRGDKITNDSLSDILSEIVDEDERNKLKDFFAEIEKTKVILGDKLLCG